MSDRSKVAQQTYCPNFDEYTEDLEQDMQILVKEPTDKRLKIILLSSNDAMRKFLTLSDNNVNDFERYKIPKKIYDGFHNHVYSVVKKKCSKGIDFRRVTTKKDAAKKIRAVYKNYWFYNAPKEMSRYLWIPLLTNIAQYFHRMASFYSPANTRNWDETRIETFLKLRFLKNIFEVKCQINAQSNPCGPVIQFAVWKIPSMQSVLNLHYDDSFSTQWISWLSSKTSKGKKMRINKIITKLVKTYAHERFHAFCVSNHVASEATLSSLEINAHKIRKIKLSRYFCDDEDVSFDSLPSDQSLSDMNIKADTETVDEIVSVSDLNNMDETVINNGYKGYHGAYTTHSAHPETNCMDSVKPQSAALKQTKCERCRKCKYHCRCNVYDKMWMQWMQQRYNFFRKYNSYLMSISQYDPYFRQQTMPIYSPFERRYNEQLQRNYNNHEVDSFFAGSFGNDYESIRTVNNNDDERNDEDMDMFPYDELNMFPQHNYGDTSNNNNSQMSK